MTIKIFAGIVAVAIIVCLADLEKRKARSGVMIGTAIKLARNPLGISASDVARKAGIARSQ